MKRKSWVLAGAAVLTAVTATGGVVGMSSAKQATTAAQEPPANTMKVERGKLSAMVSLDGTLTYRARSDGSPYSVINQAPTSIAAAQAAVNAAATRVSSAQAALPMAQAVAAKDVAAARQTLADAYKNLEAVQAQIDASTAADKLALANAQQALNDAQKTAQTVPAVIAQQIEQAKDKLYADQVADDAAVGRGSMSKEARQAALDADQMTIDQANASAQQQLAQSQQTVNTAQSNVKAAQANLANDQAKFQGNRVAAQTQVHSAQSNLAGVQAKSAQTIQQAQASVASAQSALATARASYNNTAAPPTQADTDAAQAQVASAQAAATQAQNNLDAATLKAPVGTYTKLPDVGDKVDCGDVLYRVDDNPVLLLCGTVPAYRDQHTGDAGQDVRQLNRNLHKLGYDAAAGVDINPDDNDFTSKTEKALEVLQHDKGFGVTGELHIDDAVFLPESVRVAKVTGELGGPARPGIPVLYATSDTLEVQVDLDASQQGEVKTGDPARITLPGNKSVTGKVARLGRVAELPAGQNKSVGDATIPAYISLDDPEKARGLDKAPVQVEITTEGVESALSVPVTALVGKSGGGFAVEVVRNGGRRELVAVKLGLFDTAGGRVQVEGDVREGDRVVVPSL